MESEKENKEQIRRIADRRDLVRESEKMLSRQKRTELKNNEEMKKRTKRGGLESWVKRKPKTFPFFSPALVSKNNCGIDNDDDNHH